MGIPVILYMAIMSNIDVCQNLNKSELYNRIFAEKGGIFDKFFDGEKGYSSGTQILRAPKNIRKYLEFMNIIAFTMYEKIRWYCRMESIKFLSLVIMKERQVFWSSQLGIYLKLHPLI